MNKYRESIQSFKDWRNEQDKDPILGYCSFQHDTGVFYIEGYPTAKGLTMFVFYQGGRGFEAYTNYPLNLF